MLGRRLGVGGGGRWLELLVMFPKV
jgi:hypothetical protein